MDSFDRSGTTMTAPRPSHDAIARRAYELYLERGGHGGDPLHDWLRAVQFVSEHSALHGPINLTSPEPVSNHELSRALGRVLHRPSRVKTPALALRAVFGEGAEPLLESRYVVPAVLQQSGFTFRYSSLQPALEQLLG